MHIMKYYEVSHRWHTLLNPMSIAKSERLCRTLRLKEGSRVLDVACGCGEYLIRLGELYNISGVGIDISKAFLRRCHENKDARVPGLDIGFIEIDGARYKPDAPFDVGMCIGADWIWKGVPGTVRAMRDMVRDGGLVIVGSPYWLKEPSGEYLELADLKREQYGWYDRAIRLGENEGLSCTYVVASDLDDWDNYESLQWYAVDRYVKENPDDPDNGELLKKAGEFRERYLKGGREYLNWAIYVFSKP